MIKKFLSAVLILCLSAPAFAAPYALQYTIRKGPVDTGVDTKQLTNPLVDGLLVYDPVAHDLKYVTLGPSMSIAANVLSATTAQSPADWTAVSGPTSIINKPTLGNAAPLNVPLSGNASNSEIVLGNDSRLADSRAPTAHVHAAADVTSGTFATARIPALAISQTTGLQTALDGKETAGAAATAQAAAVQRANHTGTQAISTVTGLQTALDGKETLGAAATAQAYSIQRSRHTGTQPVSTITSNGYNGTAAKNGMFVIIKSATVASGVATFHLTADGLSTGTALCTEVQQDSVTLSVNDATASYQMGWTWSVPNKTLTVTANKLTTSNILTGILGQAQANGSAVKLVVFCT